MSNSENGEGKVCSKCGEWKVLSGFYKKVTAASGVTSRCRVCVIAAAKIYAAKPSSKSRRRIVAKAYRQRSDIKEQRAEYQRGYIKRPEVREKKRKLIAEYRENPEYKAKEREYANRRYHDDLLYAIGVILRSMLSRALGMSKTSKDSKRSFELLGYTTLKLKLRIECQFRAGMSWENHGEWHIDHRKPVAAFIEQGITEPATIHSLCNLQPLWAEENLSKSATWPLVAANDNQKRDKDAA